MARSVLAFCDAVGVDHIARQDTSAVLQKVVAYRALKLSPESVGGLAGAVGVDRKLTVCYGSGAKASDTRTAGNGFSFISVRVFRRFCPRWKDQAFAVWFEPRGEEVHGEISAGDP